MTFQKSFPHRTDKSVYPNWEEVELSDKEEIKAEEEARHENIDLMDECIEDAKKLLSDKGMEEYHSNIIRVATSLFDKRASHQVWWKEKAAKKKFDEKFQ